MESTIDTRMLRVWARKPPGRNGRLKSEAGISRNGFITVSSDLLDRISKHVTLLYDPGGSTIALRPEKESNRNTLVINRTRDRSSGLINAASFIAELKIPCGRYKAHWSEDGRLLLIGLRDL